MNRFGTSLFFTFAIGAGALSLQGACSSDDSSSTTGGATCASPGGPVLPASADHCGGTFIAVDPNVCSAMPGGGGGGAGGGGGGGGGAGGAAAGGGTSGGDDFGATMNGSEGHDDDCKYDVKWTSTAICENAPITFTVDINALVGGAVVPGASPYIEAFLNDKKPAPSSGDDAVETSPGVYSIANVKFDEPGKWTVRFHIFGDACDEPSSPHGHAAFFVDVP